MNIPSFDLDFSGLQMTPLAFRVAIKSSSLELMRAHQATHDCCA